MRDVAALVASGHLSTCNTGFLAAPKSAAQAKNMPVHFYNGL